MSTTEGRAEPKSKTEFVEYLFDTYCYLNETLKPLVRDQMIKDITAKLDECIVTMPTEKSPKYEETMEDWLSQTWPPIQLILIGLQDKFVGDDSAMSLIWQSCTKSRRFSDVITISSIRQFETKK